MEKKQKSELLKLAMRKTTIAELEQRVKALESIYFGASQGGQMPYTPHTIPIRQCPQNENHHHHGNQCCYNNPCVWC